MKKGLLITGVFFLFISNLHAQENNDFVKNKTTFGVKGGLNYSYLYSSDSQNLSDLAVYIGFFSETRFSKKWSFQSELLYSTSSSHRFLEIPLLLKYHINDKWSVFVGPSLSFPITDRNVEGRGVEPLGLYAALGTQYNFSKRFFIEGVVNLPITSQINATHDNPSSSFFRNTFRIGIGYRF